MTDIKIGSIVWLKGGSPKMTVRVVNSDDLCVCTWFDNKRVIKETFHIDQLTDKDPASEETTKSTS
jgi:uncharacterized protein YodC (DUF2158 family)